MSITFQKNTDILNFPSKQNRKYPLNDKEGQKGVLLRTAADVPIIDIRLSSNPKQLPLSINNIDNTLYTSLKNWHSNICIGILYKFQYSNDVTGESGVYVRWINGFNFQFDGQYYKGEIVLEKEL